jgi:hypothetical protein
MQAPPGQPTGPALRALLADGTLAGDWVLDARRSSVRLKSRSVWGLAPVNGVFREVSGSGAISRDGLASVAALGRCRSTRRRPSRVTVRSGSTPRSALTGPTSASPGIGWAWSR